MRRNLEAFLIQSAYLEGLLQYIADFHFFSLIFSLSCSQEKLSTEGDKLHDLIKHIFEMFEIMENEKTIKNKETLADKTKKMMENEKTLDNSNSALLPSEKNQLNSKTAP